LLFLWGDKTLTHQFSFGNQIVTVAMHQSTKLMCSVIHLSLFIKIYQQHCVAETVDPEQMPISKLN